MAACVLATVIFFLLPPGARAQTHGGGNGLPPLEISFHPSRGAARAACEVDVANAKTCFHSCTDHIGTHRQGDTAPRRKAWGHVESCFFAWIKQDYFYPPEDCQAGEKFEGPYPGKCVADPEAPGAGAEGDKDLGCSAAGRAVGNPCDAATGNKYQSEDDYRSGDGLLGFTRYYNSGLGKDIGVGMGWTSSVHTGLEVSATDVVIRQATGRGEPFTCNGTGACAGDPDTKLLLDKDAGGYTLTLPDGATERYDPNGRRLAESDRSGKTTSYSYEVEGRLQAVTGPFGRSLSFAYDTNGHLASMLDPAGEAYTYTYDANDNLTRVTYPDGTVRSYHYEDAALPHHLTGITDANGDRVATYAYDTNGKAILTERAGGQQQFTLSYDSDTQSTVTDAIGTQEVLSFTETLGVKNLLSRINQSDGKGITQFFDANNNLVSRTDEEGRITTYTYNVANQRLTMTAAAGTLEARTTTFAYVSEDIDLPTEVTTPSVAAGQQRRVITVYDANNNPTAITQAGFTPDAVPVTRTITMAYNALGQVIQIDGPRTDVADVTRLAYYECTSGGECGQLKTLINAAGHTTTYEAYDAHGRVTRLTDPNAVVTTFTYDLRGRVLSITRTPPVGPPRTTTNTYDGAGQLLSVTTADGITLTYDYDAAGNLIALTDNLNNRIEYAYDLKGNRIREETKDPEGTLVRLIERGYDARDRLNHINAAGSLTQMINDAVGNLVSQTDPNANPPTAHAYDALDRVIETIDALGGTTGYGYDINDRITQVTAPNNATTLYLYDDLGNLLEERSPDRGTRVHTYDEAGNLKTLTDARGITASYSYDALNRITAIDYPGTAEDITLVYDGCENGIGRICTVHDESGTTRLSYDPYGNVVQQVHTELGIDYTTAYSYDAGDRVIAMTYPDGLLVTYTRDGIGRIIRITTTVNGETTTLLDGLTYRADGFVTAQTFGNGLDETRAYDQQGRLISQLLGGADTRVYGYDANGNLTAKYTVPAVASYSYDSLDRLNAETLTHASIESIDYRYDPNGNRLGANEESYNYAPASNRLTAIDTSAVTLDAAGNTLSDAQGRSLSYNAAGRLAQFTQNSHAVAAYTYNFQGQRTRKVTSSATTLYHYDLSGNLISETTPQGQTLNQYIWANATPIAAYLGARAPGVFTFSGTDHTSGKGVRVRIDTNAERLAIEEAGGFSAEVHPDRWVLDETTQTLDVFHRTPAGTRLTATFALAATPPSGRLSVATTPRRARYRFPNQTGEPLSGSDPATGERATLSLDPSARTVTLNEHGITRTLPIAPEDWTSIGFGPIRLTLFRLAEPEFGLIGLVLERRGSARGFLALRDGIARQANYELTGQAARTAELVYVHTDHLSTPRLATNDTQTVLWRWEGLAFGNTAAKEDPDGDGVKTTFNLRLPGQYHDGESGLYYNWNRYYDPKTGRYVRSDPIGFSGGLNTYSYTAANPLSSIDPIGLLEWTGTFRIRGLSIFKVGGSKAEFMLTSECDINDRRATVKVEATQFNVGIGAPMTQVNGSIEFSDGNIHADPFVFQGGFSVDSIGLLVGKVDLSFTTIYLGDAVSRKITDAAGFDAGILLGVTGSSHVTGPILWEKCECPE